MDLRQHITRTLEAIDTGSLGTAVGDARCTINGQIASADDLAAIKGRVDAQPTVIDLDTGRAVAFATVESRDGARTRIVGVRIGIDGDRLTELELLVSGEGESSIFAPERLVPGRNPVMEEPLPQPGERHRLISGADRYFSDIADNAAHTVFRETCQRIENGFQTTGNPDILGGSTAHRQMAEGWFGYITEVRGRRYPIVDTATGVVLAVAFLDVPGTVTHLELTNGKRLELPEKMRFARSTLLFEQFKVDGDELVWIEAIMVNLDFGAPDGWEHTD